MLMRTYRRIGLALLIALAVSTPVSAQLADDRLTLNASFGPSFANLGTTFAATTGLDFRLNDRVTLVGEFGMLPRASMDDAREVAPPFTGEAPKVTAYHWNGNLKVRPFDLRNVSPYVTAGVGSFVADAVSESREVNGITVEDRRRATDLATNLGAGLVYRVNDWLGLNADYRTFFVHRDAEDPRVHRFTTGVSFFLK